MKRALHIVRLLRTTLSLLAFVVCVLAPGSAAAHGMRTAYIELRERSEGEVEIVVRSNASYGGVSVVMPEGCAKLRPNLFGCSRPLRGSVVRVDGLGGVVSDAVLVAILRDGTTVSALARPNSASWTIPEEAALGDVLLRYARSGFAHVLAGGDHLLFLAALVIVLRRFRAVVLAETAFTISHSISFSATALGWIHVPVRVAEAAIALTLVLLALDARKNVAPSAMGGARMAFVFGAVHGLGFAGGLAELGVPKSAALPALAGFAAGVELAQLAFLVCVFVVLVLARRVRLDRRLVAAAQLATGAIGSFWFIERVTPMVRAAWP
jgi:hydrogenase/urease accessory protein HupE